MSYVAVRQKFLVENCLHLVKLSQELCKQAWGYVRESKYAMLADHEPHNYDSLIADIERQLEQL